MGKDIKSNIEDIRKEIGYVSQTFVLYKDLTVEENINFFSQIFEMGKESDAYKTKMLDLIGLDMLGNRLAANLSGGHQTKTCPPGRPYPQASVSSP